jgi:UDP-N-acetylmuramate--alanine ligase
VTVLDDYAHHPAEIRATLEAVSEAFEGPLTVVFQPHLYSRTAEHLHGFAAVLRGVPRVVLTDVYAAREDPERGVQTDALYDLLVRAGHPEVHYVPQLHDVPRWLEEHVRPGDVVITVGAGDVVAAGEQFLRLAGAEAAQK